MRNIFSARLGRPLLFLCFLATATTWFTSCYNEKFTESSSDVLELKVDTLTFDTVLTQVSTVTRYFKVFNPHAQSLRISEIKVTGPQAGFFTINADGYTGDVISSVDIHPEDSIYVFVEALIDPNKPLAESPFFLEADIVFTTNGVEQKVKLIAWGQNANYIPGPNRPNQIAILTCDLGEEVWNDPKPYVVYGTLLIDSCTLVLPPGTRLYIHGGIANNQLGIYNEGLIYTLPDGKMEVLGTRDQTVIISDDRIESDYTGQYAGIRLGPGSGPHIFSHMELTNALAGIFADSASQLRIDHSTIAFTGGPGVFARHAEANISNCLFYENDGQAIALTYGGDYEINYCTMANFGNDAEAMSVNNFFCYDPFCEVSQFNPLNLEVNNCIVIGSSSDEFWMVDGNTADPAFFNITMKNNMVVVDELLEEGLYPDFFTTFCTDCFEYAFGDTLFVDLFKNDYHLDTNAVAIMKGLPLPGVTDDLELNPRDPLKPDIGCYEFQE